MFRYKNFAKLLIKIKIDKFNGSVNLYWQLIRKPVNY